MEIKNQWDDFLVRQFDPYAHAKYKILLAWMGPLQDKNILVVGSGSGEFPCMLAKLGGKVDAIDISQEAVDLTQQTAAKFGIKLNTYVAFLETFETNDQYDYVIATDVIEHIENDILAVQKMESLTRKNGGKLLLTVPAMQSLFGHHDRILGHYRRYSKKSLKQLLSSSCQIHHLRHFGFSLIPVALLISKIMKISYPVKEIGLISESKSFGSKLLQFIFNIEKKIPFPLGTSLLLMAEKQ